MLGGAQYMSEAGKVCPSDPQFMCSLEALQVSRMDEPADPTH